MMKKIFTLFLAALMILSLAAGCGTAANESTPETEPSSSESASGSESESASDTESASASDFDPENPDYSKYLNDDGMIEGVKALDVVTLPDFATLSFARSSLEAEADVIETDIQNLLSNYAYDHTDPNYAVGDGDTVNIDYVGSVDGVEFEGGSTGGKGTEVTIGVTSYIDGFLEQLIGHRIGENFDIDVTFPDPYTNNEELSGKAAVFNITINSVKLVPELTQDLINEHLDEIHKYFNDDSIRNETDIRNFLYDYHVRHNLDSQISSMVSEGEIMAVTTMPETVIKLSEHLMDITSYSYYQATFREFADMIGYSEEDIMNVVEEDARLYLFTQAVAEQQGISADEAYLRKMTNPEDDEQFDGIKDFYGIGYLKRYAIEEQVFEYLHQAVTITDGEPAPEEAAE